MATLTDRFVEFKITDGQSDEFRVDWEGFVIYGVKLGDYTSQNQNRYSESAISDLVHSANRRPVHTAPHGTDDANLTNGQIQNPRFRADGKPIGDWHLEKNDPRSKKWLESADRFPGNFALSLETPNSQVESELGADGWTEVLGIKSISHFNLVTEGGTNKSLSEGTQKGRRKMATQTRRKKTRFQESATQLIEKFADLPNEVQTFIRESCTAVAENETVTAELDEARNKLATEKARADQAEAALAKIDREKAIIEEWKTLTADLDAALLKDVQPTDEELAGFAEKEPAEVSADFATRLSKVTKTVAESATKSRGFTDGAFAEYKTPEPAFSEQDDVTDMTPFERRMLGA